MNHIEEFVALYRKFGIECKVVRSLPLSEGESYIILTGDDPGPPAAEGPEYELPDTYSSKVAGWSIINFDAKGRFVSQEFRDG